MVYLGLELGIGAIAYTYIQLTMQLSNYTQTKIKNRGTKKSAFLGLKSLLSYLEILQKINTT